MAVTNIYNATIEEISQERNNQLVTVIYWDRFTGRRMETKIRMVVGPRTVVVDTNGTAVSSERLKVGMIVNAIVSGAITRSIPPQSEAFFIEIVSEGDKNNVTIGRILDIDRNNKNFTTISDGNISSITRFNIPEDIAITDRRGRNINFSRLLPGMQVEVRHADFMTASIPPQTTAMEIRVL